MSDQLEVAIREEADKLIARHQQYATTLAENLQRIERRSGVSLPKNLKRPSSWDADPGFDPYHVRSRARTIAYAIRRQLQDGEYSPRPAVVYQVPKADGETRDVSVFQVADNAISRMVFKELMRKNANRLSSRCYAYRTDLTLHDAVLHISSEFRASPRLFLAEFDFSKFFDLIDHSHLKRILKDRSFFMTPREHSIVWAFLEAGAWSSRAYTATAAQRRERGIPQGTSISLFLANVAAFPLDHRLEKLGVGFVRYADDTLIWSEDYSKICSAAGILHDVATDMGVEVNLQKSEGVSILADSGAAVEFKRKDKVSFIGYSISRNAIGIKGSSDVLPN